MRSGSPSEELIPGEEHGVRVLPWQCQIGPDGHGAMPVLWLLLQHQHSVRAWRA